MKLKKILTWPLLLLALTLSFAACSSDSEETVTTDGTSVPDDMAGVWDFADFTLTLDKTTYGIIEYTSSGANSILSVKSSDGETATDESYDVFTYTYSAVSHTLTGLCLDHMSIIFEDVHLTSDGRLVLTYEMNGEQKTASGTKHTFLAVSKNQLLGTWNTAGTNAEYFNFADASASVMGYANRVDGWHVLGSSVWISIDGKNIEFIRHITITGNVMKAHVYTEGYWVPVTLLHTDNGGNDDTTGGSDKETIDNGSSSDGTSPDADHDGSYWGD